MPKWKNIPPNKRSNWSNLNEGQRRYAYEQYNLALVRRGLPIDHERPNVTAPGDAKRGESTDVGQRDDDTSNDKSTSSKEDRQYVSPNQREDMAPTGSVDTPVAGTSGSNRKSLKRHRTNDSAISDVDGFSLPGTGADALQNGNGFENEMPKRVALPRPKAGLNSHIRYYSKFHRFISWGVSYQILLNSEGTPPASIDYHNITTPFAAIPWDRVYLYMNPAEFNSLPYSAVVTSVRCTVRPRNVRIAFPTNSSASELATLNQNKDISYIYNANNNLSTINVQYKTFQDGQPMIPVTWEIDALGKHSDLQKDLYGELWKAAPPFTVPRHQMGIPTPLPTYMMIPYVKQDPEGGYPCLQEYTCDFDADDNTGDALVIKEYKPTYGLITTPYKPVHQQYRNPKNPQRIDIPRAGMSFTNKVTQISVVDSSLQPGTVKEIEGTTECLMYGNQYTFETTGLIEKSQIMHHGIGGGHHCNVQPSLHVAVQPVPAIDTSALQGKSNSNFTDTQAYWEVYCEMEVNTKYPCPYPLYNGGSVQSTELTFYHTGNNRDEFQSTFNGLMQKNVPVPKPD